MSTTSTRKLAAILFADIVGYTALMQNNEQQALSSLEKFKAILEIEVPTLDGKIIQFYGDGCLCVFKNAVAAVTCAQGLQEQFRTNPAVPVRIGIHVGEVVFKEGNVFGDAVNITSRIESFGVADAVLFSEEIKQEIHHHAGFKVASLGRFKFKNSKKSRTVYALANEGLRVPTSKELQGKGQQIAPYAFIKKQLRVGLIGFFTMAIGALIFSQYGAKSNGNSSKIATDIKEQRIAILPFKNNTNDKELDVLGDMAADWINQGLMNIEEAEVVSPYTVRSHKASIGITANDPQGRPSFAQLTGARNIITGKYYQEKDELIFKLELVDALDGKLLYGFDPVRGNAADKEVLITQLREIITGYWAAKELVDLDIIKAPNFEAYKLYAAAIQGQEISNEKVAEILALDSTFYLPRIHFLNSNRFNLADRTHFDFLERHRHKLNTYEKGWYDFLVNYYAANKVAAFESLNRIRKKYPNDFILNQETASVAVELLYNPALAIEIYDELDISNISPASAGVHYNWRIQNYATSLYLLDRQADLEKFCTTTTPNEAAWLVPHYNALLFPAVANSDVQQLKTITQEYKANPSFNLFYYWLRVFGFARYSKNTPATKAFWIGELEWMTAILGAKDSFGKLVQTELDLLKNQPISHKATAVAANAKKLTFSSDIYLPALTAIERGDTAAAQRIIIQFLDYLSTDTSPISSSYKYGFTFYDIGVLCTKMGQYDQALLYLQKAVDAGMTLNGTEFLRDDRLQPLHDLPDFRKLIEPIWPEQLRD